MIISVKGQNVKRWTGDASRLARSMDDFSTWRVIGRDIDERFRFVEKRLFGSRGASGAHGRWPPLSEKYRRWKQRHFPGRPLMVLTGRLRKGLTRKGGDHIATVQRMTGGWMVKLGTEVRSEEGAFDYPLAHQEGTAAGGKIRRTIDPTRDHARAFIRVIHGRLVRLGRMSPVFVDRISEELRAERMARFDVFRP